MLKTAVVTPMPSANAMTASTETNRARTAVRAATFKSRLSRDLHPRGWLDESDSRDVGLTSKAYISETALPRLEEPLRDDVKPAVRLSARRSVTAPVSPCAKPRIYDPVWKVPIR